MRDVKVDQLSRWIDGEFTGVRGVNLLAGHIIDVRLHFTPEDAISVAAKLLRDQKYRIAHALVRSGIYQNWRLANRRSLRSDQPDDAYHIVNASYADFFVTTEPDQADHFRLAVPALSVFVYDSDEPLISWLPRTISDFSV